MIISNTFEKIRNCLALCESMHLSNNEEEMVVLELVRNFNKLMNQVLTKQEAGSFKIKVNVIKQFRNLEKLKVKLKNPSQTLAWQPYLGLKTNICLKFMPTHEYTIHLIFSDLLNKVYKINSHQKTADHYYIVEHKTTHSLNDTLHFFNRLMETIKHNGFLKIIIKSQSIRTNDTTKILDAIDALGHHLSNGTIIIEVSDASDFKFSFNIIQHLAKNNHNLKYGLSFSINDKTTIYCIDHLFKTLSETERERFILRVKKGVTKTTKKNSYQQQIKLNCYYKWSIFTIINYVRKNNCTCIINSNNLYDISWILAIRAQMNMKKTIKFETNISKFPNIAKVLYMINQPTIHTESIYITSNTSEKLSILLEKLIDQGHIYEGYKYTPENQTTIFKKSHRRFFNYLQKNYLEKYLKNHSLNCQNH